MSEVLVNYIVTDLSLEAFCRKYKYHILYFNRKNKEQMAEIITNLMATNDWDLLNDYSEILENLLSKVGKPDFFLYNEKEFLFCEFKSRNDFLRKEQIEFIRNNPLQRIIVLQSVFEPFQPELLQIISKNYKDKPSEHTGDNIHA